MCVSLVRGICVRAYSSIYCILCNQWFGTNGEAFRLAIQKKKKDEHNISVWIIPGCLLSRGSRVCADIYIKDSSKILGNIVQLAAYSHALYHNSHEIYIHKWRGCANTQKAAMFLPSRKNRSLSLSLFFFFLLVLHCMKSTFIRIMAIKKRKRRRSRKSISAKRENLLTLSAPVVHWIRHYSFKSLRKTIFLCHSVCVCVCVYRKNG